MEQQRHSANRSKEFSDLLGSARSLESFIFPSHRALRRSCSLCVLRSRATDACGEYSFSGSSLCLMVRISSSQAYVTILQRERGRERARATRWWVEWVS